MCGSTILSDKCKHDGDQKRKSVIKIIIMHDETLLLFTIFEGLSVWPLVKLMHAIIIYRYLVIPLHL